MVARRARVALALALALAASAAPAARADDKAACLDAAERGQSLRSSGKLVAARAELLACARDTCPSVVRGDCQRWLGEVEASLSSVVIAARDAAGVDLVAVRVIVDGVPVAASLDGRAVLVDPGAHVFRYETEGAEPREQHVVIREGDKNRVLAVSFAKEDVAGAAPTASPFENPHRERPSEPPRPPLASWVLGGVAVVSVGSFAYFGWTGNARYDDLKASCSPDCARADTDKVFTKYLVADVSLGIGILAAGAAAVIYLSSRSATR